MMIKNTSSDILQGQISIFDLDLDQPQKPKKELEPLSFMAKPKVSQSDKFTEIINLYKSTAARIVKRVHGALLLELEDKTLYFNSAGINELVLKKDIELMPADEILFVNQDKEVNELQLKKLKDMQVKQYIKREGDDELFITEMATKSANLANNSEKMDRNITKFINGDTELKNDEAELKDLQMGDKVEFNYDGPQVGKITRIYNNGETVNVSWYHKNTAFYYKCVKKII